MAIVKRVISNILHLPFNEINIILYIVNTILYLLPDLHQVKSCMSSSIIQQG